MAVVPRTLKQGDVAFVKVLITDITGADISGATYMVAHILDADKTDDPDSYPWEYPDAGESGPVTDQVYRVAKLVTAELVNGAKTKYRVFVRVSDVPEILHIDCGTYTVVP